MIKGKILENNKIKGGIEIGMLVVIIIPTILSISYRLKKELDKFIDNIMNFTAPNNDYNVLWTKILPEVSENKKNSERSIKTEFNHHIRAKTLSNI